MAHLGLLSRVMFLAQGPTANIALFVPKMPGLALPGEIAGRIPGNFRQNTDPRRGVVEFVISGSPANYPGMNGRVLVIPLEDIVAIEEPA